MGSSSFRDPILLAGIGLALVAIVFALVEPALAEGVNSVMIAELGLIALVLVALLRPARRPPAKERRFRAALATAWALWALVDLTLLVGTAEFFAQPLAGYGEDMMWSLFYAAFLVATLGRPDAPDEADRGAVLRAMDLAATLVFAAGLCLHVTLLPAWYAPESYATSLPSIAMYTLFDACLVARLAFLCSRVPASRWRVTYGWLLAVAVAFLVSDGSTGLIALGFAHDVTAGGWLDLLPHLFVLAAVRRGLSRPDEDDQPAAPLPARTAALTWALVLAAIHFGSLLVAGGSAELGLLRGRVVLASSFLLGALALAQQWLLLAHNQRLLAHQRRVSERLELSRRMEAGGRLAAGIAHDFNNLLQVIHSAAEALGQLSTSPEEKRCIDTIVDAANRGAAATHKLSSLEQQANDEEQLVDLDLLIGELEPMLRRLLGSKVELVVEPAHTPALVSTNRAELEHALLNLAVNAADAMPNGGTFRLTTVVAPLDGTVELTVADDGEGMAPEVRARAFEPFYTTKESGKGTGLGLSMVYAAVTRSGGSVDVESAPGRGAAFRLRFPPVPSDYELIPAAPRSPHERVAEAPEPAR